VPSPVKVAAGELGVPVLTPRRAGEVTDALHATGAELGVVVAFGQLLPPPFLAALPGGFVNLHFSLLPRWRGAAPVERAILAGDSETGVCVMAVDETLDTGAVFASVRTPIGPEESAGELRSRLVALGADLLVATLPSVPTTVPTPQAGEPTYAEKLTVGEFRLDPGRPAGELARLVRAGNPRPGAWLDVDGTRLKVLRAHVEDDRLVPDEVQPAGKRPMPYAAWRAGWRGPEPLG
jgi:methionyl-tRNA formyltransferase